MGGLLDLIDEEMKESEPKEDEPILVTLGELVKAARDANIKPGEYDGSKYYTFVFDNEAKTLLRIEATTDRDFQRLKARGKL